MATPPEAGYDEKKNKLLNCSIVSLLFITQIKIILYISVLT